MSSLPRDDSWRKDEPRGCFSGNIYIYIYRLIDQKGEGRSPSDSDFFEAGESETKIFRKKKGWDKILTSIERERERIVTSMQTWWVWDPEFIPRGR